MINPSRSLVVANTTRTERACILTNDFSQQNFVLLNQNSQLTFTLKFYCYISRGGINLFSEIMRRDFGDVMPLILKYKLSVY